MSLLPRRWRKRARLHALRFVSLLIAAVLPLQVISGAVAAIQAPAHYHLRAPSPLAVNSVGSIHAPVAADLSQPEHASIATVQTHPHHETTPDHKALAHAHGHDVSTAPPPSPVASASELVQPDHHAIDVDASRTGSPIGHHAHEFADAGVVYLDGSPDRPDGGSAAGKHTATTDAALTGWWMSLRSAMGMQSLPAANWRYRSRLDAPALRPPATSDAPTA